MANKRITEVDYIESLDNNESFFVNQNNTLRQINRNNVLFGVANGGTGATTAEDARANLGAISMASSTVSLSANSWSGNMQICNVSGITADNTIIVSPEESKENYETYGKCKIRCVAQADGNVTFECKKVPDIDINVNVVIFS